MTPSNLVHSLLCLRGLVEREEHTHRILQSIDSFEMEVAQNQKQLTRAQAEVQELRSQTKKLRNKTKRLENEVWKCSQEINSLAEELRKVQDIHRFKIQKMNHYLETQETDHPTLESQGKKKKGSKCSFAAQCQILVQSTIQELQEKYQKVLNRMNDLERRHEEHVDENRAKDAYIEELLHVLENEGRRRRRDSPEEAKEKQNDNSTLDNESEKGSEFALPQWLEGAQSGSSVSMETEPIEEIECEDKPQEEALSWMDSLRSGSIKLCSFIFG